MPPNWNLSVLSLIPKVAHPEVITFRRIGLCNTFYKIITKVIVNRLRPFIDKMISPFQSAFMLGRSCAGNALIAQEILHSFHRKKDKKGFMILGINLKKLMTKWNGTLLEML